MMRSVVSFLFVVTSIHFAEPMVYAQAGTCSGMTTGQLTSLNGFVPFPSNNLWNTDISAAPADPNSANLIAYIGNGTTLHADFGSGTFSGGSIGIPYQVVDGTQPKVNVKIGIYLDESDPSPMPIPSNALIEGYPKPGNGDRHVLVLEKDGCWLYELGKAYVSKKGVWSADVGTVWDMLSNQMRPYTWTSVDAAGLAVFAGLARFDEVAAGAINHALRFTVPSTRRAFVAPASHWASSVTDPNAPPMGMRIRLKAGFDISGYSATNQILLTAMKKYGMILADNGSGIFISGAPDSRWNNSDLHLLGNITASNFEVVQMGTVYTDANVPVGPSPTIGTFTANPASVAKGQQVTLSWSTSGASYNFIAPQVGPVRTTSLVVTPSATTTYTLYSTNQFGRATASVTVTVQ